MRLRQYNFSSGLSLELVHGDITSQQVDAIVNAANNRLRHGAGVAGAIVRRGGPEIQRQSDAWMREHGSVSFERPAYTTGGRLPCKYVIHAVGPVWGEGDEDARLSSAVLGSLERAQELDLESIALPAISTGIFGFPKERAARQIFMSIRSFFERPEPGSLRLVRLVLYDHESVDAFLAVWVGFFGEAG